MNEAEWWAATDPERLIDWLFFDALAADRKLRLFSVAACQPLRRLVAAPGVLGFLDVAEAFADGRIGAPTLSAARNNAWAQFQARHDARGPTFRREIVTAEMACLYPLTVDRHRTRDMYPGPEDVPSSQMVAQAIGYSAPRETVYPRLVRLLHDVFGPLPFREVPVDPRWLTSDVVALVRGVYDEKAFDRLPILADALQDAGCANDEILSHCRAEGWEHARGCWVTDLLLGRPWREEPHLT